MTEIALKVEISRVTRAKVRSMVHTHLQWLERTALNDTNRAGLSVTRDLIGACHAAIRRSTPDIEGTAAQVVQSLAKHWVGASPVDPTFRAVRAALNRLARLSPFVRRTRTGWRISLGLARCTSHEDPRLLLLVSVENDRDSAGCTGLRPSGKRQLAVISASDAPDSSSGHSKERARTKTGGGQGLLNRASWLVAAARTGRVWGQVTADLLSLIGSARGSARDVAAVLLSSRKGARPRKWARNPFTANERVGVTRALRRLVDAGLVIVDGEEWSVPEIARPQVDRDLFEVEVSELAAEFERLEQQRPKAIGEAPAISVLRTVAKNQGLRLGSHEAVRDLDRLLKRVDAERGTDFAKGEGRWRYLLEEHAAKARFVAPYLFKVVEQIEIDWEREGFTVAQVEVTPAPVLPPPPVQRAKAPAVTPPAFHHVVPTFVRATPLRPWEAAAEARALAKGWKQKDRFAS